MDDSFWIWVKDKIVPSLLVATFGLAGTTAFTVRSNSIRVDDLRQSSRDNAARIDAELEKRQSDCAMVKALLHATESRLGILETRVAGHDEESHTWKDRINRNEQVLVELRTNAAARPDPFTGSDGRELEKRIRALEQYQYQDEERMKKLLGMQK